VSDETTERTVISADQQRLHELIGFAGIYGLVSARRWFTGPRGQGTPEELAAAVAELEALA